MGVMPAWATTTKESPAAAKKLTAFSFIQLTGGILIIRGCIAPFPDSLNFVLDTGSGGISLDSTTAEMLKIPTVPSDRTIRGIAGMHKVNFAYNKTLLLPGLAVDSLHFHINDYSLLSSVYGITIDGIIGYSFFKRYIIQIDYDKQMLEVFSPGYVKYPRKGYLLKPTFAGLPMQQAMVKEDESITARFYLDTGAGLCLLLSEEFCADSTLFSTKKKRFKTITEGLGGKKNMEMTVLKQFKIGPYKFKKVPTYIFDDEFKVTAYPYLAGLIGNDLLRRFNVTINYPQGEIHLLPNAHYNDPFDYTYTGLGLYADIITGDTRILDVMQDSPAAQAGLEPDDIIIAMDNHFGLNLQEYKNLLQNAEGKIKIIVKRNKELIEVKLSIKSIL